MPSKDTPRDRERDPLFFSFPVAGDERRTQGADDLRLGRDHQGDSECLLLGALDA